MTTQQASDALLNELRTALGAGMVQTDAEERRARARDWWPRSAKWSDEEVATAMPLCVITPSDVQGIQVAVRIAIRHGVAVVPFGAGSGVCGAVCSGGHVSLDVRGLREMLDFAPTRGYVRVEAGAQAADVERQLNEVGYTTGHYPQSLPLATIGGLVSTRSSGTFSSKYGNIENLVMGLSVVLPNGTLVHTPAPVRGATGPDLKQLFIGAEGSLGVITAVTLRVFKKPERQCFLGYRFPSVDHGLRVMHAAFGRHLVPAVARLYDETEAAGLYRRVPGQGNGSPLLIVAHEGASQMVDAEKAEFARLCRTADGVPLGNAIGEAWESHRFDASWIQRGNAGLQRMADAIEVSAPWHALPTIYNTALERVRPLCSEVMAHWSHFYSTGACMYLIFMVEGCNGADAVRRYEAVWQEVMRITQEEGGCISHHHGIGSARRAHFVHELGTMTPLWTMVRQALDPAGLFNPDNLHVAAST